MAVEPLARIKSSEWTRGHAAHLLRRAGFGGNAEDVNRLAALGLDGAVESQLDFGETPDIREYPDWADAEVPRYGGMFRRLSQEERRKLMRLRIRQGLELQQWWMRHMMVTAQPCREKLTLFWHGHFATSQRKVRVPQAMLAQNRLLRAHAAGNCKTLVHEIARDPAMLRYLDNDRNRKGRPNENFARELMELFTLGIGHYTEQDIKESARAFTGWTQVAGRFRNARRLHDSGRKTFLGRTGRFDGDDIIDIIFEQPAVAPFIGRKLLRQFYRDDPEPAMVEAFSALLRSHNWELRPALHALFRSRAFYAPDVRYALIRSPVDLVAGTARTLRLNPPPAAYGVFTAAAMGQTILAPPNVKGWDGGKAWINSNTLLTRYNFLAGLLYGLPPGARRRMNGAFGQPPQGNDSGKTPAMDRTMDMDAGDGGGNTARAFDPDRLFPGGLPGDPAQAIDEIMRAAELPPLNDEQRQAAALALRADAGANRVPQGMSPEDFRVRQALLLLMSTPQYQLA